MKFSLLNPDGDNTIPLPTGKPVTSLQILSELGKDPPLRPDIRKRSLQTYPSTFLGIIHPFLTFLETE
jgi:hypothetical protein